VGAGAAAPVRFLCINVRIVSIVVVLIIIVLALLLAGSLIGLAFSLLWLALTGLVIGALGRLVLPGRQEISLLATALVGIAASLLGGILADIFDVGWIIQFLVAVLLAAIGITLFASAERGRAT
jgi:uncharacterized membrane protein YeaQ/YmgE (transglycosylase-associated protein family)